MLAHCPGNLIITLRARLTTGQGIGGRLAADVASPVPPTEGLIVLTARAVKRRRLRGCQVATVLSRVAISSSQLAVSQIAFSFSSPFVACCS